MRNLLKLIEKGQSYWIDNLTRNMITDGELQRRVTEEGCRGVTSNPAIFYNAISSSRDYDAQIAELVQQHWPLQQIYEELVVTDVRNACDILRKVYDESEAHDGFVSLEVSPHLAHQTDASLDEARRLWHKVDRPNLLIKIPGTSEGVPAIETLLSEGINVNVTLLFSVERYQAIADAYARALEHRIARGFPIDHIISVASFFLSPFSGRDSLIASNLSTSRICSGKFDNRRSLPLRRSLPSLRSIVFLVEAIYLGNRQISSRLKALSK